MKTKKWVLVKYIETERRIIKIVEKESDLGLAQIGSTFFPAGALKFYRDKLRELGLYNIPEDESLDDINKFWW